MFLSAVPWGCHCEERFTFWGGVVLTAHNGSAFFILYKYQFILLNDLFSHTDSIAQEQYQAHQHSTDSDCIFSKVSMSGIIMFLSFVEVMGNKLYCIILSLSFTNLCVITQTC